MKYNIPNTAKELDSRDAALLTQRLVPLSRLYREIYYTLHYCKMQREAQERLEGVLGRLADDIALQLLCFIDENPFDIPSEQSKTE